MEKVTVSPQLDCSAPVSIGKPPTITLTLNGTVYQYEKNGTKLDVSCVTIEEISPFVATLENPGWTNAVSGDASNTGSAILKRGALTITAPATGTDTWTMTATSNANGDKVKVKFESSPT